MLFLLIVIIFILAVAVSFIILRPMVTGAPYLRMPAKTRQDMFALAAIKPGETVIDLGSGDGVLLVEAAMLGAHVIGYEINPWLVWLSRRKLKKQHIPGVVYKKSLWKADVSQANVILLFGITHIMNTLEKKLFNELPQGARVVSATFQFPHWKSVKEQGSVRLYIKK